MASMQTLFYGFRLLHIYYWANPSPQPPYPPPPPHIPNKKSPDLHDSEKSPLKVQGVRTPGPPRPATGLGPTGFHFSHHFSTFMPASDPDFNSTHPLIKAANFPISLGSHQNIGLHTGARANAVLLTYLLTYFYLNAIYDFLKNSAIYWISINSHSKCLQ